MIRLLECSPGRLRLVRFTPLRPTALAAVMLLVLAVTCIVVGWSGSTHSTVALALLGAASLEVGRRGLPRRRELSFALPDFACEGRESSGRSPRPRAIVLTRGSDTHAPGPLSYRIEIQFGPGGRKPVFERDEPAGVLADLRELLTRVELPVERGWGLPDDASPWRTQPPAASAGTVPATAPTSVVARTDSAQGRVGFALLVAGALLGAAATTAILARLASPAPTALLSVALPLVAVALIVAVGAAVLTDCVEARYDGRALRVTHRILGLRRATDTIEAARILGAYAVGPDPDEAEHLLLETDTGLVALRLRGRGAVRLAQALTDRSESPHRSGTSV